MAKPAKKNDLTIKQEKACRKFIETGDKSAAYRHAYSTKNMKPATVNRRAFDLFELGKIQARVGELRAKIAKRNDITQDRVLKEYAKLAFLDPRQFYDETGELIPVHKLPANVAATLTAMDVQSIFGKDGNTIGDIKKIKFADKKAALDSVAKHLGMFIERHEHTGKDGKELFPQLNVREKEILKGIVNAKK
jgi:phage terminase small subunit